MQEPFCASAAGPSLLQLPSDLFPSIFEHLGAADLYAAGKVCRELRVASQNRRLWRHARVCKLPEDAHRTPASQLHVYPLVSFSVLKRAAAFGNREAAWLLGRMYMAGQPLLAVPADEARGMALLLQAAALGHAQAQYELSLAHARRADDANYIYWTSRAANQGHALAQIALGLAFACGRRGLPQDLAQFQKWRLLSGSRFEYRIDPNMSEEQARAGAEQASLWRAALEADARD